MNYFLAVLFLFFLSCESQQPELVAPPTQGPNQGNITNPGTSQLPPGQNTGNSGNITFPDRGDTGSGGTGDRDGDNPDGDNDGDGNNDGDNPDGNNDGDGDDPDGDGDDPDGDNDGDRDDPDEDSDGDDETARVFTGKLELKGVSDKLSCPTGMVVNGFCKSTFTKRSEVLGKGCLRGATEELYRKALYEDSGSNDDFLCNKEEDGDNCNAFFVIECIDPSELYAGNKDPDNVDVAIITDHVEKELSDDYDKAECNGKNRVMTSICIDDDGEDNANCKDDKVLELGCNALASEFVLDDCEEEEITKNTWNSTNKQAIQGIKKSGTSKFRIEHCKVDDCDEECQCEERLIVEDRRGEKFFRFDENDICTFYATETYITEKIDYLGYDKDYYKNNNQFVPETREVDEVYSEDFGKTVSCSGFASMICIDSKGEPDCNPKMELDPNDPGSFPSQDYKDFMTKGKHSLTCSSYEITAGITTIKGYEDTQTEEIAIAWGEEAECKDGIIYSSCISKNKDAEECTKQGSSSDNKHYAVFGCKKLNRDFKLTGCTPATAEGLSSSFSGMIEEPFIKSIKVGDTSNADPQKNKQLKVCSIELKNP